jgi:hypothetical protein
MHACLKCPVDAEFNKSISPIVNEAFINIMNLIYYVRLPSPKNISRLKGEIHMFWKNAKIIIREDINHKENTLILYNNEIIFTYHKVQGTSGCSQENLSKQMKDEDIQKLLASFTTN